MKVIIDAYGGDHAPLEILKGVQQAVSQFGVNAILTGNEEELRQVAAREKIPLEGISIVHAGMVMPVEADPTDVTRGYADSSMTVGLKLLADGEGDAFVTAGSTGAAVVGASLLVKRIKGIKRAAIATVVPSARGCYMLIDAGANAECRPEMLTQFGIMGSIYMERIMGTTKPRVGVINIGAERNKGLDLQIEACAQLENAPVNFIGNVEARELPLGGCDVAVADGFVGNVVLKLTEGMGKWMSLELKKMLMTNAGTKMGALLLKDGLTSFKEKMDYTEYGGAPLMGISKPVIKAHGSSNAKAIKNAVRQAKQVYQENVIGQIQDALLQLRGEA